MLFLPGTILILSTLLSLGLAYRPFPSGFLTGNLHAFLFSPLQVADYLMLIKFSEEYKLQRPHYAVAPNSLLVLSSSIQKISSIPFS